MSGYGQAKWPERLARIPPAHESVVIARVQSMRTRHGHVPEPLSYEASITYLRNVERVRRHRVTVPAPRALQCQPAPRQRNDSPPEVAAVRAGASLPSGSSCDREHEHSAGRQFPIDKRELPDMSPEQWDVLESAAPF